MKTSHIHRRVPRHLNTGRYQRGILLIEVLCAILIFSFGVLGLVGLQTAAVAQSGDAKYRSIAAELADQYINQMWIKDRTAATVTTVFQPLFQSSPAGAAYTAWLGSATTPGTVMGSLPGVTATANAPTVTFAPQVAGCNAVAANPPITCSSKVTITMFWQSPHDNVQHNYVVNAQISLY